MNLPDVEGYATSDLFEPHPTKDGLWKMLVQSFLSTLSRLIVLYSTGRKDDVITLSSGKPPDSCNVAWSDVLFRREDRSYSSGESPPHEPNGHRSYDLWTW